MLGAFESVCSTSPLCLGSVGDHHAQPYSRAGPERFTSPTEPGRSKNVIFSYSPVTIPTNSRSNTSDVLGMYRDVYTFYPVTNSGETAEDPTGMLAFVVCWSFKLCDPNCILLVSALVLL